MFRSSLERLRAWLTLADDVLGDPVAPAHPHRQPLRWRYERRAGGVPAAPAVCISPVRAGRGVARRDRAVR